MERLVAAAYGKLIFRNILGRYRRPSPQILLTCTELFHTDWLLGLASLSRGPYSRDSRCRSPPRATTPALSRNSRAASHPPVGLYPPAVRERELFAVIARHLSPGSPWLEMKRSRQSSRRNSILQTILLSNIWRLFPPSRVPPTQKGPHSDFRRKERATIGRDVTGTSILKSSDNAGNQIIS